MDLAHRLRHNAFSWLLIVPLIVTICACRPLEQEENRPTATPRPTLVRSEECSPANQTLRWDFTDNHDLATVGFPEHCWEGRYDIFIEDSTIHLLLPDNIEIGPLDSRRTSVSRKGLQPAVLHDVLIQVGSEYLTAQEAYELVMGYVAQYDLPADTIQRWYDSALSDPPRPQQLSTRRPLLDGSVLTVEISLSLKEERPYVIYIGVLWPYDWNEEATSTLPPP